MNEVYLWKLVNSTHPSYRINHSPTIHFIVTRKTNISVGPILLDKLYSATTLSTLASSCWCFLSYGKWSIVHNHLVSWIIHHQHITLCTGKTNIAVSSILLHELYFATILNTLAFSCWFFLSYGKWSIVHIHLISQIIHHQSILPCTGKTNIAVGSILLHELYSTTLLRTLAFFRWFFLPVFEFITERITSLFAFLFVFLFLSRKNARNDCDGGMLAVGARRELFFPSILALVFGMVIILLPVLLIVLQW